MVIDYLLVENNRLPRERLVPVGLEVVILSVRVPRTTKGSLDVSLSSFVPSVASSRPTAPPRLVALPVKGWLIGVDVVHQGHQRRTRLASISLREALSLLSLDVSRTFAGVDEAAPSLLVRAIPEPTGEPEDPVDGGSCCPGLCVLQWLDDLLPIIRDPLSVLSSLVVVD